MSIKEAYITLQLEEGASEDEIKRNYRRLALKYHPDRCPEDKKKEAEERFKVINEAYSILCAKRKPELSIQEALRIFEESMQELREKMKKLAETLQEVFAYIRESLFRMNYLVGLYLPQLPKNLIRIMKRRNKKQKDDLFFAGHGYSTPKGQLHLWLAKIDPSFYEGIIDKFREEYLRGLTFFCHQERDDKEKKITYIFGYPFFFLGSWHFLLLKEEEDYIYLYIKMPKLKLAAFERYLMSFKDLMIISKAKEVRKV